MRSSLDFVMHPSDEEEFVRIITAEPGMVFVDGPRWSKPEPPITTQILECGNYSMVWNPLESPGLSGRHIRNEGGEWWYCENEFLTIQFLRSGFLDPKSVLLEGRIAIATTSKDKSYFEEPSAHAIERRFKRLRWFIQRAYRNSVVIWQNPLLPRSKTNPIKPAANVWVGPHAIHWLREAPEVRCVQQFPGAGARGYLLDLVS